MKLDLTGQRFGKLLVSSFISMGRNYQRVWLCKCDCGGIKQVTSSDLRSGNVKSCGCAKNGNPKHKMTNTPTYLKWKSMKSRCLCSNSTIYYKYGGRGIKVCDRWMKFENFLSDMGIYPIGLTLERINNNGNYEPSNCRWATYTEQAQNTRRSVGISKLTQQELDDIRHKLGIWGY